MVLQSMKLLRVLLLALAVLAVAPSAWAAELDSLRVSGAVGERYDGLAVARDGSASGFVASVNAKRSKIYQQRAAKEGVSARQVGKLYAKQIMSKAPRGTWFLSEGGTLSIVFVSDERATSNVKGKSRVGTSNSANISEIFDSICSSFGSTTSFRLPNAVSS